VLLDFNDTLRSLQDFVNTRIAGWYDSISIEDDFHKFHVLSLKCFRKKAKKERYGSYAWILAFDRFYSRVRPFALEPRYGIDARRIRYLIVLNSSKADKDKAESKFISMIQAFVNG
jgi:hypothetical protein